MSDTSIIDDDEFELPEDNDGEGDEGQGANADEGQEDAPEGDEEGGQGQEEDVTQPRRSRANDRVRRSVETAKAEKERADRFERELQELRQQVQRPDPFEAQRQAQMEQERLALMSPDERADYRVQQMEHRMRGEMQQTRLQMQEESDKAGFRALQATNKLARQYAPDVERVVAEQKARGMIVNRETALKFVIGEKAFEKASTEGDRQRRTGAARVAANRTNPGRVSGQQERGRDARNDDSEAALERRLAGKSF